MMLKFVSAFFKGAAMGAANVIPGVSGGTIALITGIFERLINAIKNIFSIKSFQLFFKGKIKDLLNHIDFGFLVSIGIGIIFAIVSIARILEFLFANYPVHVWAFFFGLVMASVWFVAKTVTKWNIIVILFFLIGTTIALLMAILKPMAENSSFIYLILSGAVAACSMILPGLSGSFVLVLMGNYELVAIRAVNDLDIAILFPVFIGASCGLLLFSYALSWIFKNFKNQTIAILSGFMAGSLLIIWPWKEAIWKKNEIGEYILSHSGNKIVEKYNWLLPNEINLETIVAIALIILGIAVIAITETIVARKKQ